MTSPALLNDVNKCHLDCWRFGLLVLLNHCLISGNLVSLKICWQSDVLVSLNARWQFGDILLLSRNDRVSSFYWIKGSQHYFLTSCSYLNCYFLFLVFLHNRYLLVSSRLSRLHRNLISHPVFSYFLYSKYHVVCLPPYFWHTSCVFSKQDTRGNLV